MYRDEWAEQRAVGVRQGEFAECWGIDRSTHARWIQPDGAKKREHARRIGEDVIRQVIAMDRQYRSTWDARALASRVTIGASKVHEILMAVRGPRPALPKRSHQRRTRFLRRDVMWSSDFMEIRNGLWLLKTMDESSRYRLGWNESPSQTAEGAVQHGEDILRRMGYAPLVWKYDHGSQFTSRAFQDFLARHNIVPFPTPPRAPWANGRIERDHQEIQRWLIPVNVQSLPVDAVAKEVDDGMRMLNFIKPRWCLNYRTSADVYFSSEGVEKLDRNRFRTRVEELKRELGPKGGERLHRKAVRLALQEFGLYEEWEVQPSEAKFVNGSGDSNAGN